MHSLAVPLTMILPAVWMERYAPPPPDSPDVQEVSVDERDIVPLPVYSQNIPPPPPDVALHFVIFAFRVREPVKGVEEVPAEMLTPPPELLAVQFVMFVVKETVLESRRRRNTPPPSVEVQSEIDPCK